MTTATQADPFFFELPGELIAQEPPAERGQSRLLCLEGRAGTVRDMRFADLPDLVEAGDLLVLNDTRVVKARLHGRKPSGGLVEILIERVVDEHTAWSLVRASHAPRVGGELDVANIAVSVLERNDDLFLLRFASRKTLWEIMEQAGNVPLPPYIERSPAERDEERYQTVYARNPGAVAAPTAGLHFDLEMFRRLEAKGVQRVFVTLHVGAGTFQPVRTPDIEQHRMHSEHYHIPEATANAVNDTRASNARVIAVGTTTLRALEAASRNGMVYPGSADTNLFIRPGYRFQAIDRLITNFHLPRSTLLMLVCAFAGTQNTMRAYRHAVSSGYRFFSYGDAMLVDPAEPRRDLHA
jgi:S-adenosylmethionine:tRNA ribosyltransferase-isomerase